MLNEDNLTEMMKSIKDKYKITRYNEDLIESYDEILDDTPYNEQWIVQKMIENMNRFNSVSIDNMLQGFDLYHGNGSIFKPIREYIKDNHADEFIQEFKDDDVDSLITGYLEFNYVSDYIIDNHYVDEDEYYEIEDDIKKELNTTVDEIIFNDTDKYIFSNEIIFAINYQILPQLMKESDQEYIPCTRLIDLYFDPETRFQIGIDQSIAKK